MRASRDLFPLSPLVAFDEIFPTRAPGLGIEMQRAALQRERAVNSVQGALDRPMHGRLRGVHGEQNLRSSNLRSLRLGPRRRDRRGEEQREAEGRHV